MTTTASIRNFIIALFVCSFATVEMCAQNSTASPYSMFGVGMPAHKEDAVSAGMGHASIALAPSQWLNVGNPAGINNLDTLSFYLNFQLQGFYARNETLSNYDGQSVYSGNIDGIAMGFRARHWLAFCFGYAPQTSVGYRFYDTRNIAGSTSNYNVRYTGSGGLQQAYFTMAFTAFRRLSLGASFNVSWGSIKRQETALFSELGGEDIYNKQKYTLNNVNYELGAQFYQPIGQNNFRIGVVFSNKRHLYHSYDHDVSNDISSSLMHDDDSQLNGEFYLPRTYGFGFSYNRRKFTAAIDYRKTEWAKTDNIKFSEYVNFRNNYSIGGGVQYQAGKLGDPFYKRIQYRAGYYYRTSYLDMRTGVIAIPNVTDGYYTDGGVFVPNNGSKSYFYYDTGLSDHILDEHTFTLGLTVPVGRSANVLSLSFEHMERGTYAHGLIYEKYNTIKLAFTVHETWFMRSKFD